MKFLQRGPIACGINAVSALYNYTSGIFQDTTNATTINHYVKVVGWGVQNGTKFWWV